MPKVAKRIASDISSAGDEWFRRMAESASDLIAVLDPRGRRVYANPALMRLLGAAGSLVGTESFQDVHPEDRGRIEKLFAQTVADGIGRRAEYRFLLPGGEVRHFESQGNTIPGADGRVKLVVVMSRDVTERRRIEDDLRAREVQLQEAQAVGNLGSWELDLRSGRIWWSDQLRRIFGVDERHVPTLESHLASVHPEDRAALDEASRAALASGRVYDKPYRILRPDGGTRVIFNSGRMERDADGRPARLLGVCMDITDKTWIERRARSVADRLRSVSRRLVEVQEAERRLLARELHDRVGQSLTALGLNLRVIASELGTESGQAVMARMEDCMRLVEDTVGAMRDVMGELRPQALDDYGLLAALRSHVAAFSARTGIHVAVQGAGEPGGVPKDAELALFRIAQEALNNVAKHSRATAVKVAFDCDGGEAVLALSDDGIGFDPAQDAARAGWGLVIMRERAESIGASFELDAAPGRGVRIAVRCPA
jgi:two-component system sensor histidine kinase UhpB